VKVEGDRHGERERELFFLAKTAFEAGNRIKEKYYILKREAWIYIFKGNYWL